jgi:TolB-like protein
MVTLLLAAAVGAAPAIAAPGLTCSGVDPALCDAYLEHFVANLTNRGVKVTTKNDVAQLVGIERQKQLLGCATTDGSCLAELAGALGVAMLLSGTVAKTESGYVSTLKLIDASDGATKWSATTRVDTEKQLFAFFDEQASAAVATVAPDAQPKSQGVPTVVKWIPAMAGAVAIGVGVGLLGASVGEAQLLKNQIAKPRPLNEPVPNSMVTVEGQLSAAADRGRALQLAGWLSVGLGGAAVVSSLLWWLLTPSPGVSAALVPMPGGGLLSFSLELP